MVFFDWDRSNLSQQALNTIKQAAGAFLKGYQTYAKGSKAPDSLLKLAMSLERLGQKDAACSSFGELSSKFPTAPAHIKSKAQSERQHLPIRPDVAEQAEIDLATGRIGG